MKIETIEIFKGTIGFLNGNPGLHGQQEKYAKFLVDAGKTVTVIDDLYDQPLKLNGVTECETLYLQTTGIMPELPKLVEAFRHLNYAPKFVIFDGEHTAMALLGIAREFKKEHGTRFFFEDLITPKELLEINWI